MTLIYLNNICNNLTDGWSALRSSVQLVFINSLEWSVAAVLINLMKRKQSLFIGKTKNYAKNSCNLMQHNFYLKNINKPKRNKR